MDQERGLEDGRKDLLSLLSAHPWMLERDWEKVIAKTKKNQKKKRRGNSEKVEQGKPGEFGGKLYGFSLLAVGWAGCGGIS